MRFVPREVGARWPCLSSVCESMRPKSVPAGSRTRFSLRSGRPQFSELAARIAQTLVFLAPGRARAPGGACCVLQLACGTWNYTWNYTWDYTLSAITYSPGIFLVTKSYTVQRPRCAVDKPRLQARE
eukprot:gene1355-biopygen18290